MYLERIKNKLGSTNAKICTGESKTVKRLARKKGGYIKRSRHAMGDDVAELSRKRGGYMKRSRHVIGGDVGDGSGDVMYAMGGDGSELARKKGGYIKRSKRGMGGNVPGITPAPSAAKFIAKYPGHKKGKRVKREHHYLGAMLGALSAASAIPGIIDLVKRMKR